ncbi:Transcriptional regulator [Collimonas arenae]|uniref:Transcriptional regulator n=1 Tax=Collimonas arenae TaxID=279058 RepID=A0A0A1F9A8_9BURK|nr:helix-turn-helix transcriptional regulator [Collimonas arenae]AIY39447.1 Transcriptional regulator [Collimonas arenae]
MDDQAKLRDKTLSKLVGARLAARRKELKLTQADLAEKLGIEKESVSRLETGVISASLGRLSTLADALDLSMESLLRDVSAHPSDQAASLIAAIEDLPEKKRALVLRTATELAMILKTDK